MAGLLVSAAARGSHQAAGELSVAGALEDAVADAAANDVADHAGDQRQGPEEARAFSDMRRYWRQVGRIPS